MNNILFSIKALLNIPEDVTFFDPTLIHRFSVLRQIFDPPENGTVQQSLDRQASELEWGVRRYQNPDGSLTTEGQRCREQRDHTSKGLEYVYQILETGASVLGVAGSIVGIMVGIQQLRKG